MATDGKATWWTAVSGTPLYPASELRQIDTLDVMPGPSTEPFSGRPGRRVNGKGLDLSVSSTGNGTVTVSAGVCLLYSSSFASLGVWKATFPQVGPIALTARPTSGQSRIDLVVARLYDSESSIGAVKEAKIEVLPGSPNASPSAPSLPANSITLILGTLTVPASGTITFTQTTQRTTSAGGILPVDTTAERDALVAAGIAYRGLVVDNAQTGALERWNGTIWRRVTDQQSYAPIPVPTVDGNATGPGTNPIVRLPDTWSATTSAGGLVTITFPTPFATGIIGISLTTISGTAVTPVVNGGAISKTGTTIVFPGVASAAVTVFYEAIGW